MGTRHGPLRVSGITGEQIAAQVVWQMAGPSARTSDLRAAAFSWLGLSGPAPRSADVMASSLGRSSGTTIRNWMRGLAPGEVDLTARQLAEIGRPTLPGEDHTARVRRARLLGVPDPTQVRPTTQWKEWNRPAIRIVDAVGPVTTAQLIVAIAEYRTRALRHRPPESYEELPVALAVLGDLRLSGGRWHRTVRAAPQFRDGQVVAALRAGPATFTYSEYHDVLRSVGYRGSPHLAVRRPHRPRPIHTDHQPVRVLDVRRPGVVWWPAIPYGRRIDAPRKGIGLLTEASRARAITRLSLGSLVGSLLFCVAIAVMGAILAGGGAGLGGMGHHPRQRLAAEIAELLT